MTVSDARARFSDAVDQVRVGGEPIYLMRRKRAVAALIAAEDLDRLIEAADDLVDIRAAQAARQEMADGAASIPWDEVKRDLGLA